MANAEHRPPNLGYPPLAIMRASGKSRPCPWCHADVGQPCRADNGSGIELTHFVHPARLRSLPEVDADEESP